MSESFDSRSVQSLSWSQKRRHRNAYGKQYGKTNTTELWVWRKEVCYNSTQLYSMCWFLCFRIEHFIEFKYFSYFISFLLHLACPFALCMCSKKWKVDTRKDFQFYSWNLCVCVCVRVSKIAPENDIIIWFYNSCSWKYFQVYACWTFHSCTSIKAVEVNLLHSIGMAFVCVRKFSFKATLSRYKLSTY